MKKEYFWRKKTLPPVQTVSSTKMEGGKKTCYYQPVVWLRYQSKKAQQQIKSRKSLFIQKIVSQKNQIILLRPQNCPFCTGMRKNSKSNSSHNFFYNLIPVGLKDNPKSSKVRSPEAESLFKTAIFSVTSHRLCL